MPFDILILMGWVGLGKKVGRGKNRVGRFECNIPRERDLVTGIKYK